MLASLLPRFRRCPASLRRRAFSTDGHPTPLYLWLGEKDASTPNSLLLPVASPSDPSVFTAEDILDEVNAHYNAESQFVGGMGEHDPGVWFAAVNADPLSYAEVINDSIHMVKEERHGVPFHVFTSGLVFPSVGLDEMRLECLHVSLFAGSPKEYANASGNSEKDFGTLCGFIVEAAEQGIPVEAWVLEDFAAGARDLALSLGAQHVTTVPSKV
eukprot:Nitzschia sp. Nitz4//scaffold36_size144017//96225//96866//NITZ4_003103-RA/size144017-processed-gene-0.85-mRNA-1//-1//CDS//3329549507//6717//frame0